MCKTNNNQIPGRTKIFKAKICTSSVSKLNKPKYIIEIKVSTLNPVSKKARKFHYPRDPDRKVINIIYKAIRYYPGSINIINNHQSSLKINADIDEMGLNI